MIYITKRSGRMDIAAKTLNNRKRKIHENHIILEYNNLVNALNV